MKNIHFLLIVLLLAILQSNLFAQQQGFGCIKNKGFLSFSGIEKNNKTTVKPVVDIPPIFGKKARKNGHNLPLPFGMGIYSIYYDQEYTASNLRMTLDSSSMAARADTLYQSTTAYEFKAQVRPNFWLFPFLNVYGIFGYTKGVISPNLVVPYIVVENIPIIDSIVIALKIHHAKAQTCPPCLCAPMLKLWRKHPKRLRAGRRTTMALLRRSFAKAEQAGTQRLELKQL